MQSHTGSTSETAALVALAATHAHYVSLLRTLARSKARVDGAALCAEFIESLERVLNPESTEAEESAGPDRTGAGTERSDAGITDLLPTHAPDRPFRRPTTESQRVAYRQRLAHERSTDLPGSSAIGSRRPSIAAAPAAGYDPFTDARAVAASLPAIGGKQ